jgi:hypothetical protein
LSPSTSRESLAANGVDPIQDGLLSFGEDWGSAERLDLRRIANENTPKLKTHSPRGERADIVEFHPAYHRLMEASVAAGIRASVWDGAVAQTPAIDSGNVMALDVLRAASRRPQAAPAVLAALAKESKDLPGVTDAIRDIEKALGSSDAEAHVRFVTDRLATLAATAALAGAAPREIAETYANTRLPASRRIIGANEVNNTMTMLVDHALPMGLTTKGQVPI